MLEIRPAQFQAFRQHFERDFRRRLRNRLRKSISGEVMNDAEIDEQMDAGLHQARDCRLTREIDVARFVEAVCIYLGGFPPRGLPKPALPILYAHGVSAELRIDRFIDWCRERHGG